MLVMMMMCHLSRVRPERGGGGGLLPGAVERARTLDAVLVERMVKVQHALDVVLGLCLVPTRLAVSDQEHLLSRRIDARQATHPQEDGRVLEGRHGRHVELALLLERQLAHCHRRASQQIVHRSAIKVPHLKVHHGIALRR